MASEDKGGTPLEEPKVIIRSGDVGKRGVVTRPTNLFTPENAPASPVVPVKPADSGGSGDSKGD